MRYTFLVFLFPILGCSSGSDRQRAANSNRETNGVASFSCSAEFRDFYKKFSSDSTYQSIHIIFPLRTEVYDLMDTPTISYIGAKEWGFMDFNLNKPYIIAAKSEGDTTKVNIQIEDTGIYVDYLFTKIKEEWKLVKVVDQST